MGCKSSTMMWAGPEMGCIMLYILSTYGMFLRKPVIEHDIWGDMMANSFVLVPHFFWTV